MAEYRKHVAFKGKILMVGFGAVGQGTLPLILRHVGAYAVVARVGKTRKRAFRHMLGLLPKDRLIGSILNEGPLPTHARHYGYYADDEES